MIMEIKRKMRLQTLSGSHRMRLGLERRCNKIIQESYCRIQQIFSTFQGVTRVLDEEFYRLVDNYFRPAENFLRLGKLEKI
jgi:hypothetical protein